MWVLKRSQIQNHLHEKYRVVGTINVPVKLYEDSEQANRRTQRAAKDKKNEKKMEYRIHKSWTNQLPHVSYCAISNNLSTTKDSWPGQTSFPFLFPFSFVSKEEKWRQPVIKLIPSSFSESDKLFSSNKFKVML